MDDISKFLGPLLFVNKYESYNKNCIDVLLKQIKNFNIDIEKILLSIKKDKDDINIYYIYEYIYDDVLDRIIEELNIKKDNNWSLIVAVKKIMCTFFRYKNNGIALTYKYALDTVQLIFNLTEYYIDDNS